MAPSFEASSPQSSPSTPEFRIKFEFNASRGIKVSAVETGIRRDRRKFPSNYDKEAQEWRELRHRNMMRRQKRMEELADSHPAYVKALDTKECMLEVQGMLLGRLAMEDNHIKGLAILHGCCIVDFDERAKEVGEAIQALQD